MGRPSRKRPREPESKTWAPPLQASTPSYPFGTCPNSDLASLIVGRDGGKAKPASGDDADESTAPTAVVQGVWGRLSEADIANLPPALSVGVNVEIDEAGVAWLINTSTQGHPSSGCTTHDGSIRSVPETQECCDSTPLQRVAAEASLAPEPSRVQARHDRGGGLQAASETSSNVLFGARETCLHEQLSSVKRDFDEIPAAVFKRARSACNPAEALGRGSFLNRSAMKLANIDAIVDGLLTLPCVGSNEQGLGEEGKPAALDKGCHVEPLQPKKPHPSLPAAPPLLFADLCGGPGGFSEYLLRRRRKLGLPARGWGISLRQVGDKSYRGNNNDGDTVRFQDGRSAMKVGVNDDRDPCRISFSKDEPSGDPSWRKGTGDETPLTPSTLSGGDVRAKRTTTIVTAAAAPSLEMHIDYGPNGTGDLTDEANIQGFVEAIRTSTGEKYLDLVVADGGFGAARDALQQERLLSPLVHAEALTALLLLREEGSFVCKLFECWTESTAALLYLLHRKFRRIAIVKPIASRPASGERYLVCTGFLPPLPSAAGCPFTDALRAKVQALQIIERRRSDPVDESTAKDPREPDSSVDGAIAVGGSREGNDDADGNRLDVAALGIEADMKQDASFLAYLRFANNRLASLQAEACARIIGVASTKRGRAWAFRDSISSRNANHAGGVEPWGRFAVGEAPQEPIGTAATAGGISRHDGTRSGGDWEVDGCGGQDRCMTDGVCSSAGAAGEEGEEADDGDAAAMQCFWRAWGLDGL
ncbi:conserved unknown protein [Ectocarpus siliculosus]|uniref:Cap-specific mRNA (nucleoside-2'-O-)-methyltransferase 1 n=1 Tax=Ectocarpus siliculosus TaxID=2880 RepID=D8LL77_ECTSI|nr:conserved unknown protein [Ectocarpus siliculosus]|eukprot:CBN76137.1 conserved unknown protein [Ectocarpus siliculosus]